jgi:hypothetical protein
MGYIDTFSEDKRRKARKLFDIDAEGADRVRFRMDSGRGQPRPFFSLDEHPNRFSWSEQNRTLTACFFGHIIPQVGMKRRFIMDEKPQTGNLRVAQVEEESGSTEEARRLVVRIERSEVVEVELSDSAIIEEFVRELRGI